MENTLQKFGHGFQTKCIVSILTDKNFLEQSIDVIDKNYFEGEANKWIIDKITTYYLEYHDMPTLDVFQKEADKIENNNSLKVAISEQLNNIYVGYKVIPTDIKYIKKEFLDFCKNQAIKNAILKSVDLLQTGKYEQIKHVIDNAMKAGQEKDVGHIWKDSLEDRITKQSRKVIETPWSHFNTLIGGGLGCGELGLVIAPSGVGKSYCLQNMAHHAMMLGRTVVYYTLELGFAYTGLRFDTICSGIETMAIPHNIPFVKTQIEQIPGNLIIKKFPSHAITITAIRSHYQSLNNQGIYPDLIMIDYLDLMRSTRYSDKKYEELELIAEEMRGFGEEMIAPVWTASQSNRSSLNDDIIEADKIAGSYAKIAVADIAMSLSRKKEDKIANTGRMYILKNRFGIDGVTLLGNIDFKLGKMQFYPEDSIEGAEIAHRSANSIKKMNDLAKATFNKMTHNGW